ncbi:KNR4-like cell wall assembly/cell proliferation coordinating protein [Massilia sp. CCM 8733]|uniref:KNR4-like cell wall assembly/cell proliferation coordinating protein n=1 Tax=Massilia mucilaginosa TaxID=2609282 RepID=A0ABX0NV03_9BURK|nr:SMI1/KNR4 family protein [Massilia mucilaginosa]NHZ90783.1 KNR4-like cell wall assembly/cell proliferation coordinating protein [Massilia mucilaginosa]
MEQLWARIERRLAELGCLDKMALRPGADPQAIAQLERHLGVVLPDPVKRFLAIHDGQDGTGLVDGYTLLSIAGIQQQWDGWRELDEEAMNADCADSMGSEPAGTIKPMYTNPAWIALTHDYGGNHVGLDLDPDLLGQPGQVIAFGRDEDVKRLLANSFPEYMDIYVAWLERARWNGQYLDVKE